MELNLTGNETAEELEAMLERIGDIDIEGQAAPGDASLSVDVPPVLATVTTQQNTGDSSNITPTPGVVVDQQQSTDPNPVLDATQTEPGKSILSRDGKHVIPYDVLEAERAEKRRLSDANQRTAAELAETKRQLEVFTRQINLAGLQPAQLPEKAQITPEQIAALRDSFPEVANVIDVLSQKVDHLQSAQPVAAPATQTEENPAMAALDATPDLKAWQSQDPDRFTLAVHIDEALKNDPAWKDKPLTERFGEVVKRTRAAYGEADERAPQQPAQAPAVQQQSADAIQQKAAAVVAQASAATQLPASPSDVGQTPTQSASLIEQAANASPEQLQALFSGMTDAQIDALLEQAI